MTIWNSVPASMEMMVEHLSGRGNCLQNLRVAMLSGDWVPVGLPNRLRLHNPATEIIGLGGATEVSIWSVIYRIGAVDPAWKSIPYGEAMQNQACYILDDQLQPCKPGVTGQIYLGGVGLRGATGIGRT